MSLKNIRFPAEWEPQSGVLITFPHIHSDWAPILEEVTPCFVEIINIISRYEKVMVICDRVSRVLPLLKEARQDRLILVDIPSNDTWVRDYGGITVFTDKGPLVWDFTFNGWGEKYLSDLDNQIMGTLHQRGRLGNCMFRKGGIVLEGGSIETDGLGTLLTTTQCLLNPNRNPELNPSQIEAILKDRFGLNRILWLKNGRLIGDDTDAHIDTLARFCDPRTIVYVRCDDPNDPHFDDLLAMEKELKTFRTLQHEAYHLVPLPWPEACFATDGHRLPATYANFLIINGAVLVPVYGLPQDREAVETIKSCFPDRAVIGLNCRPLLEQHGSLHCASMQFPREVELSGALSS